jgi:hypothetical protein
MWFRGYSGQLRAYRNGNSTCKENILETRRGSEGNIKITIKDIIYEFMNFFKLAEDRSSLKILLKTVMSSIIRTSSLHEHQ